MGRHTDFILSPVTDILKDVVAASTSVGVGIQAFPLTEYVMQSTFLKMTGFHEQKMKCICWELATDDYEYRYTLTNKAMGEYSRYGDKAVVYKDLISQIKKYGGTYNVANEIGRPALLLATVQEIKNIFDGTSMMSWTQDAFGTYESLMNTYQHDHFANDDNTLLAETNNNVYSLKKIFEVHLYKHRNRCAHNTLSYQENLPTLKSLIDPNYKYNNYYLWFALLNLMDKIYVELYRKYLQVSE